MAALPSNERQVQARPFTRTSFHHQPEAQHPKSSAIHKLAADYPIYQGRSGLVLLTLSLAAVDLAVKTRFPESRREELFTRPRPGADSPSVVNPPSTPSWLRRNRVLRTVVRVVRRRNRRNPCSDRD